MGSMNGGPPAAPQPLAGPQGNQVLAHKPKVYAPSGGQYQYDPATMPSFYQQTDPYYQAKLTPQQVQQAMQATAGLKGTELMAALPPELQSSHYMQFMNSGMPISSYINPDGTPVVQAPKSTAPQGLGTYKAPPESRVKPYEATPYQFQDNSADLQKQAYLDMMGGGHYGGVIPQSSYSTAMPGDPWGALNQMGIQNPSSPTGMTFGASPWGK